MNTAESINRKITELSLDRLRSRGKELGLEMTEEIIELDRKAQDPEWKYKEHKPTVKTDLHLVRIEGFHPLFAGRRGFRLFVNPALGLTAQQHQDLMHFLFQ